MSYFTEHNVLVSKCLLIAIRKYIMYSWNWKIDSEERQNLAFVSISSVVKYFTSILITCVVYLGDETFEVRFGKNSIWIPRVELLLITFLVLETFVTLNSFHRCFSF